MGRRKRIFGRRRDRPVPAAEPEAEAGSPPEDEGFDPAPEKPARGGETEEWSPPPAVASPGRTEPTEAIESDSAGMTEPTGEEANAELWARIEAAETRAAEAEERAEALEREREELESRAREEAEEELQRQLSALKAKAGERVRAEVERIRAETEEAVRAEAEQRVRQRASGLEEGAESEGTPEPTLAEALVLLEDAEARASATGRETERMATEKHIAEERFSEREVELERERVERARLVEEADQRLVAIEKRLLEASERVTAAERRLEAESKRLAGQAAERLEAEVERIRREATQQADRRVAEREAELKIKTAEAEEARHEAERTIAAAEARAEEEIEAGRAAAAEWLRGQADALKAAGAKEAAKVEPADSTTEPTQADREQRFRAAAERLERGRRGGAAGRPAAAQPSPGRPAPAGTVRLVDANFEQLRQVGMSVTQAKRALRYRDERGLRTVAELERVPGFTGPFVAELRERLAD